MRKGIRSETENFRLRVFTRILLNNESQDEKVMLYYRDAVWGIKHLIWI